MPLPLTTLATLPRDLLSQTFKDPRSLLAFERFQLYVAQVIPETFTAFQNLNFVVTVADPTIPNAHVITAGANIDIVIASGLVTLSATPSGSDHQIQFNNAGVFAGFTMSKDVTVDVTTGQATVSGPGVTTESGATYTAVLTDTRGFIRFTNAGAVIFTIPPQSAVAWAQDTTIAFEQAGAGAVTVVAGAGVTINTFSTSTTAGLHAVAQLMRTSADTWTLFGALL